METRVHKTTASSAAQASLLQQPVAVDFIDNRLPQHHPAFQKAPPHFDAKSRRYVATPLQEMMQTIKPSGVLVDAMPFWNEMFPDAMSIFTKQAAEPKELKESDIRIRSANSWNAVQSALQNAQNSYLKETGVRGWLRHSRRAVADNSQVAVQAWKMVPNVDVTSPVINVVQSLLEATRNAAKVRHEILIGFEGLQDTFEEVDFVFNMFPHDENVRKAGVELIVTILGAVENVIVFYIKNIVKKTSSALFHGDEYQGRILQGLRNIRLKSEQLSHQGQNSQMFSARQDVAKLNKTNKHVLEQVRTTHLSVSNVENILVEMRERDERNLETFNSIFRLLDEADKARKENIELRRRQQMLEQTVQRAITPRPEPATVAHHAHQNKSSVSLHSMSAEALWRLVDVPEIENADLQVVEDVKERIPSTEQGRMEQVINLNRFKQWIVKPLPDTLLLLGSSRAVGGLTASSVFCSTLFHAFRHRQVLNPLVFFCGLHSDDDPYFGGFALLRSFIAQLLCQWSFDTSTLRERVNLESVQLHDGTAVCQLFSWLVHQLPEDRTVVCIIDNIGYYEREKAVEETVEVLNSIARLMQESSLRATFKLLITSNTPIRETRDIFSGDSVINLAAISDNDGSSRYRMQRQLNDELYTENSLA